VVLDKYKALIHEYRNHREAVGSWLTQFSQQHKRMPSLLDAEATQDVVLISR
jgi:ribosomal protein L16 Arg81 hydroxylase